MCLFVAIYLLFNTFIGSDGVHKVILEVTEGKHEYHYMVDGEWKTNSNLVSQLFSTLLNILNTSLNLKTLLMKKEILNKKSFLKLFKSGCATLGTVPQYVVQ